MILKVDRQVSTLGIQPACPLGPFAYPLQAGDSLVWLAGVLLDGRPLHPREFMEAGGDIL